MKRKKHSALILIVVLICLAIFPVFRPGIYYLSALFSLFMFASLSVSWNMFSGYTGYQNFGHAASFGIGAYTSAILLLKLGLSPFYTCILGGFLAAVVAAVISYPCLRLRGPYFVLVTLCMGLAARIVVINIEWLGASSGLYLPFMKTGIFASKVIFYEAMLVLLVLMILLSAWIEKSKLGLGLRSIFHDEDSAETQGVNATKLKTFAYIMSAFTGGVIGGIYSYYRGYIHPDFIFDINISLFVVLMSLLGGRRTWIGPIIGASIVVVISEVLSAYIDMGAELSRMIYGLLLVVVIMYLPDGLIGLSRKRQTAKTGGL